MERSFVLVLTLVTLGTATPHGYGVKGGASAKAEASAVAGAFGDLSPIPLSIPSGSGFSGSFSKSSASSFASSSASSSSSSYSFSGSGVNGIAGAGKGCSTCPGAGATGPSLNGVQQLSGANAVSAAQAKAASGSYTPCQGSNCNGSPSEKCTSGNCLLDSSPKGPNECNENGNCQSPSREGGSAGSSDKGEKDKGGNSDDSNDFAVNINRNSQGKSSHDSNGQYSNKDGSYNPQSDCANGKCGPTNPYQSSSSGSQGHPPVPSSYLTAPNKNPPCTTPDCKYPSQNSGLQNGGLPSSYNVPIQSATNPPNTYYPSSAGHSSAQNPQNTVSPGVPCTSPGCGSSPYGASNIPNYKNGKQTPSNQGPCSSGQCGNLPSPNGKTNNGAVSGSNPSTYSHGTISSNVPSSYSGQQGCTSPYCAGLPTYSSLPTNPPGHGCSGATCTSSSLPSLPTKGSDAPVYTGGFGGPAGFLDINSGKNKLSGNSAHDYGQNTPSTSGLTGGYGTTSTHGSFGTSNTNQLHSNNNYGDTQTSSHGGSSGAFDYRKPSGVPSTPGSQFNPSHTGNHGAQTPTSGVPLGSTSYTEDDGSYKPTGQTDGGSVYSGGIDSTGSSQTSSGSDLQHGSYGVTKPNTPSNSLSSPANTNSYGGSTGNVGGSSPSYGHTGSFNKPGTGNCGSAGCNGQSNNVGGGPTSYDKTGTGASNQNKPVYNGGFGGPSGLLNPNNVNVPSTNPTASSGNNGCKSGNCGSNNSPTPSHESSASGSQNLVAASASANAVAYSGGFGGPPGFLKPYDDGKVPAHGNTANGHSSNGHPAPSSANGKNSEPTSLGNGANAVAQASATASATAGSYGGDNNHQNNNGASRGCNSGCNSNGAGDGNTGSLAAAKSNAVASAYGLGNFASSSASAHASAGAATKGGYGKK